VRKACYLDSGRNTSGDIPACIEEGEQASAVEEEEAERRRYYSRRTNKTTPCFTPVKAAGGDTAPLMRRERAKESQRKPSRRRSC